MPEARPVTRRINDAAADMGSLVRMGLADEQPVPAPSISPFLEPDWPPDDYDEPA
jgi:hypothetical protein